MTVLIPAYEPTLAMLRIILELKEKTDYRILIVDDGSGEGYRALFDKASFFGCTVLHHDTNLGKGAALKTGFLHILLDEKPDSVVCADSDGQHRVEDIISVAGAIDENASVVILGTRHFSGKVPLKSKIGNKATSLIFKAATGLTLKDTQTGLRGYPFHLVNWLRSVEGDRFEYELNLLLAAGKAGVGIRQLPIATIYDNNNKGTHFRPIKDSIKVLAPIFKFCSSSVISGILDFFLLFLFQGLSGSLLVGVVSARALSSAANYSINKYLVFNAKNVPNVQSAPRYFGLVAVIMLLNYFLLYFLTMVLHMPGIPAKLLTELLLFVMSYTVQQLYVFKSRIKNEFGIKVLEKTNPNNYFRQKYFQSPKEMIK